MEELSAALDLPPHVECFGCGTATEGRISPIYRWDPGSGRVTGTAHFGSRTQGPPGHAHGGSLATLLDEAMGASAWLSGYTVLAVSITVNYRDMVPLDSVLDLEAWVDRVEGRKVFAAGRLLNAAGQTVCDSTGIFVVVPPERIGNKVPGTHASMDAYHTWKRLRTSG